MGQSTNLRDHAFPGADAQAADMPIPKLLSRIGLVVSRSVFWAYERGSWQYDVLVLAILAFIFLSPRAWFNDRPTLQMTDLRHHQGIVELSHVDRAFRYLVDARLVESFDLKPEDAIPIIIQQHLQKPCLVKSIMAVRDRNQVILGYTVVVERLSP